MKEKINPLASPQTIRNLGIACMIGAIFFSANGIWEVVQPSMDTKGNPLDFFHFRTQFIIFGLICSPAFFAGQLGYYFTGATGKNWLSKVILGLGAIGAAMYIYGALSLMTLHNSLLWNFGLPLSQWICTVLLGIAALFAKRVAIWKRLWPIWTGIAPSILFPLYINVLGWHPYAALATQGLNWLIFGYIVYTEGKKYAELQVAGHVNN